MKNTALLAYLASSLSLVCCDTLVWGIFSANEFGSLCNGNKCNVGSGQDVQIVVTWTFQGSVTDAKVIVNDGDKIIFGSGSAVYYMCKQASAKSGLGLFLKACPGTTVNGANFTLTTSSVKAQTTPKNRDGSMSMSAAYTKGGSPVSNNYGTLKVTLHK